MERLMDVFHHVMEAAGLCILLQGRQLQPGKP